MQEKKANNSEAYFLMSMAYLELGEVAAQHQNETGEYQNAVAYQLYHALEIFLKYAILKKIGSHKKGHDLRVLFEEYNKLYAENKYRIESPFDFTIYEANDFNIGEKKMYINHLNQFDPKIMDQHLRYPPDEKTGGYSFRIESDIFTDMKNKFLEIYGEMN
ncbi:MAG: HEPN domain-containing protein [Salinivirgaceae bacterium]|nr:HEPN domain-containing protein [Salinivirgaceae bacterium]